MRVGDRRGCEMDAEGVHRRAAEPHLEMEVRAGRQPARSDIADQLTAPDEAAGRRDDLAHVPVKADEAAPVRDLDFAAVAARPAGADDLAIGRGDDRAAPTGADVDTGVEAREVQNRVIAVAEV